MGDSASSFIEKEMDLLRKELDVLQECMEKASALNLKGGRLSERARGDLKRLTNSWILNLTEYVDDNDPQ